MDDLDLDFAVTYNGQYIFNKDRVLFASPIDKRSLRQIISYAKKNRKEIAMGTRQDVVGSRIMSFGLSPLSQLVSRFVPKFLTRNWLVIPLIVWSVRPFLRRKMICWT